MSDSDSDGGSLKSLASDYEEEEAEGEGDVSEAGSGSGSGSGSEGEAEVAGESGEEEVADKSAVTSAKQKKRERIVSGGSSSGEESPVRKKSAQTPAKETDEEEEEGSAGDDEAEDEEEDADAVRRQKKRQSGAAQFFDDEAGVDSADEDDYETDAGSEKIDRAAWAKYEDELEGKDRDKALHNRLAAQEIRGGDEQVDEEAVNEYYQRRYDQQERGAPEFGTGDDMADDIGQQGRLPDVKDPNLWLVRCRIGEEKQICVRLMSKFIALKDSEDGLSIKSVIAKEGLKGYIYVEAYKQTHVKHCLDGVAALQMGQYKQKMVTIKEMTDVLKVTRGGAKLKPKTWVRLKRGVYKDDLAQIDYVETAQNSVRVKFVPRIDYTFKHFQKGPKKLKRPTQKLFNKEEAQSHGCQLSRDGEFYNWGQQQFDLRGFGYKTFPLVAIQVEGVKPSFAELERFEASGTESDLDSTLNTLSSQVDHSGAEFSAHIAAGDVVEVAGGDLIHLQGKVISVDGKNVTMQPDHEDLKDPLQFNVHELKKFFRVGDHVKVLSGEFEGDTGLIVRVEDPVCVLFSDLSMHEIKIRPRDLQLCNEISTGVDISGNFQLGDLVHVDQKMVGIIVRLERDHFQILMRNGKVDRYKQVAVTRVRVSRDVTGYDSKGNPVQMKDTVKVVEGPHAGATGQVQHLYRGVAFLHSKVLLEHGGNFVSHCGKVELLGAPRASSGPNFPISGLGPLSPRISSPRHPGGMSVNPTGMGRGMGRGQPRRDTSLIGQSVRVTGGMFKNMVGIVKDATERTVRLELHTLCQTIMVDKDRIALTSGKKITAPGSATGARSDRSTRTPMHGSQTPMHGGETPMYGGSRTPMYGSMTPMYGDQQGGRTPHYGGMTPAHDGSATPGGADSVWDPKNANTPSRTYDFDYNLDTSPSPYAANTPDPRTPATPGSYHLQNSPAGSYSSTALSALGPMSPASPGYASPQTPFSGGMSPFQPGTPGSDTGSMSSYDAPDWFCDGIKVTILPGHSNSKLANKQAWIKSSVDGSVTVCIPELNNMVTTIPSQDLEPVEPMITETENGAKVKVKVIVGDERNLTLSLISIEEDTGDAVVMEGSCIKLLPVKHLAALHEDYTD